MEGAILGQWLFSIPGEGTLNNYISDSAIYSVNERGELLGINNYVIVNKAVDVKTDWNYPNALRPETNPGYWTKYDPRR